MGTERPQPPRKHEEHAMEARIAQVAVKAGVSIATVSRAFAKPDLVSEKTR